MKAFIKASKELEVVDETVAQFLHSRKQLKKSTKEENIWSSAFPQNDAVTWIRQQCPSQTSESIHVSP